MPEGEKPKGNIPYKFDTNINKNNTNTKGKYNLPFSRFVFLQYLKQIYIHLLINFDYN
jgi:hypothetical protein